MSRFAPTGPSLSGSNISIPGANTPTILNVDMPTVGTEYSATLPANVVRFTIRLRDRADMQLAYVLGDTGTLFVTVPRHVTYGESELTRTATLALYFQSNMSGQTAEITYWTT